jgi:hypothetical protein
MNQEAPHLSEDAHEPKQLAVMIEDARRRWVFPLLVPDATM